MKPNQKTRTMTQLSVPLRIYMVFVILLATKSLNGQCVGSVTTISGLPINAGCGNGGVIEWDGPVGGTINQTSGTVTWSTTGTFRLKRNYPGGCQYSPTVLYSPYYNVGTAPSPSSTSELTQEHMVGEVLLKYTGSATGYWQTWNNGTDESFQTTRMVTTPSTYYFRIKSGTSCWSTATAIVVSSVPQPQPGPSEYCIGNTTILTGLPLNVGCGNGGYIEWDGPVGGSIDQTGGSVTWTTQGTFRLKRNYPGGCTNSPTVIYSSYYIVGPRPASPLTSEITQEHMVGEVLLKYTGSASTFWQTWEGGVDESAQTIKTVTSPGTYYARVRSGTNCWSIATATTVSLIPQPPPGPTDHCVGNTSVIVGLPLNVGCGNGNPIEWDGAVGGDIDSQSGLVTWQATGTFRLKRTYPGQCTNSPSVIYSPYYTVIAQPSGPPSSELTQRTNCGFVVLQYTGSASDVFWQTWNNGKEESDETVKVIREPGIYYARRKSNANCWSAATGLAITVVPQANPTIIPFVDYSCAENGVDVILSTDALDDRWYNSIQSTSPLSETNELNTSLTPKTVYLERNIEGNCVLRTPYVIDHTFSLKCENHLNFIKVTNPLESSDVVTPSLDLQQSISYFDGLGRPIQEIAIKGSPTEKDIVTPLAYDANGREPIKYLPFVPGSVDGIFNENAVSAQGSYDNSPHQQFYTNPSDRIARDSEPYSTSIFEPSPLNRIIKQGASGEIWQPDSDHDVLEDKTIKMKYGFNTHNEVISFTYDSQTSQVSFLDMGHPLYFPPNALYANRKFDEHNHEVVEYVDKEGRTVCKKVQEKEVNGVKYYASTYYIYDDFGNLVMVLPPEAVKALISQ